MPFSFHNAIGYRLKQWYDSFVQVTCMFVYKIKKLTRFGMPFCNTVRYKLGHRCCICLKRGIPFHHNWSAVVTKEKLQAIFKYEINNENNFAVVATFGRRSRNEVLSLT